ncbi:MAG: hypothetical protein M8364_02015 [Methylobacter sp.]|uniref:hypothetical protein n=1 Tax=Methylobacter sp. TaxID=2051955 RepID=UPI0025884BF0|nr:hypothetical protein [Methylobacter sp.]MCL7419668.1 hypothetical protein [Methylobacter sp.]
MITLHQLLDNAKCFETIRALRWPDKVSCPHLYFMGLNLSNAQIARELDLNEADVQQMTRQLRSGIVSKRPTVVLEGEVECDEVYVVAGHKGQPETVKKRPKRSA